MMDFDAWMRRSNSAYTPKQEEEQLPEGILEVVKVFPDGSGVYRARCRSCERPHTLELGSLSDFTQAMNYCGGSPRCLP